MALSFRIILSYESGRVINSIYFVSSVLLLAGCASKIPTDEAGLPKPSSELAMRAGTTIDEIGEGYWIFTRKCMECHEVKLP